MNSKLACTFKRATGGVLRPTVAGGGCRGSGGTPPPASVISLFQNVNQCLRRSRALRTFAVEQPRIAHRHCFVFKVVEPSVGRFAGQGRVGDGFPASKRPATVDKDRLLAVQRFNVCSSVHAKVVAYCPIVTQRLLRGRGGRRCLTRRRGQIVVDHRKIVPAQGLALHRQQRVGIASPAKGWHAVLASVPHVTLFNTSLLGGWWGYWGNDNDIVSCKQDLLQLPF